MKRKSTLRSLLFEQQMLGIMLFSLLILFLWIGASIYFQYNQPSFTTQEDAYPVEPIIPNFDTTALQTVSQRRWWNDEELISFPLSVELESQTTIAVPNPAAPVSTPVPTPSSETPLPTTP